MVVRASHAVTALVGHGRPTHRAARRPRVFGEIEVRPAITEELIARRAYEIFLSRGNDEGDALSDWLSAERELWNGLSPGGATPDLPVPDRYH
jgi:hypothetical protein